MSYAKQNFKSGDVLTAEALNKMDEQIKQNAESLTTMGEQIKQNANSFGIATETIISQKNSVDHVITPQHIDHAVRESTIQRMTNDREADLASMKVSDTFGNDYVGVDKQNLPVSYEAVRKYIDNCLDKKGDIKCIILEVGEEYVLKQGHHYYIHGYGDNALRVLYAEGAKKDQNALIGIEYVDDIDASISSTYVDENNYWQMFRCWIRDRSIDKVGRYTDWQHAPLVATKVRNEYVITGTESGYAYVYEMPVGNGVTPTIEISDDGYWVINGVKTSTKAQGEVSLYYREFTVYFYYTNDRTGIINYSLPNGNFLLRCLCENNEDMYSGFSEHLKVANIINYLQDRVFLECRLTLQINGEQFTFPIRDIIIEDVDYDTIQLHLYFEYIDGDNKTVEIYLAPQVDINMCRYTVSEVTKQL